MRYEPYSFFSDTMDRNRWFDLGNFAAAVEIEDIPEHSRRRLLYRGDATASSCPCGPTIPEAVACPTTTILLPRTRARVEIRSAIGEASIGHGYRIFYDVADDPGADNSNDVAPFSYGVPVFQSGSLIARMRAVEPESVSDHEF